jgi:ribosomal protein S18 acetylase RimI-like enzyme
MIKITHPKSDDLDRVFQFMIACDIEEFGEEDTSRGDFEQLWEEADLEHDVWIAIDDRNNILAYTAISAVDTRYTVEMYLSARFSPTDLENKMMKNCLDRIDYILLEHHYEKVTVIGYSSAGHSRLCKSFKNSGFQEKTYHFRMQTDFHEVFEKPVWPEGYRLDAYTSNDEQELYRLITEAFDWEGHITPSIETWRWLVFRGGRFDPQYFVLVRDNGKLVAAALSYAEDTGGWIRQLAVAKEYRSKGLGGLLLRNMFWMFSQAGLSNCALGVASVNSNACQFYEHNGMHKTRHFIEFNLEKSQI